jgi:hypothetical protein
MLMGNGSQADRPISEVHLMSPLHGRLGCSTFMLNTGREILALNIIHAEGEKRENSFRKNMCSLESMAVLCVSQYACFYVPQYIRSLHSNFETKYQ